MGAQVMNKFCLFFLLLVLSTSAMAQTPTVTSTTGTIEHGGTLVIGG